MYVVYETIDTSSNYSQHASLTPAASGQRFMFQTGSTGNNRLETRIDTSLQTNQVAQISGFRTPGSAAVGWLQVSNNATVRATGFNQAAPQSSGTLSAHTGWNFTGISQLDDSSGRSKVTLVFNAAHDQTTRAQVIGWLAQKYGVNL